MTLIIDLSPAQEDMLRDRAARAGMDTAAYVRSLIDTGQPTEDDWLTDLIEEIAVSDVPDIDASREGIYADL